MRTLFFVSDGTGITAETLGHTLLTQFESVDYRQRTLPFVDTLEKARHTVDFINATAADDGCRPVVFSTLVHPTHQDLIATSNALVLDFFGPFIKPLEREFRTYTTRTTGRSHGLVNRAGYYFRIDAVNFALHHDDGARVTHYDEADVILVGVSRAGKTPTCLYLAMQFGVRAANYPLTPDDYAFTELPKVLRQHKKSLYGLTIDPERLHHIRNERRPHTSYASMAQCRREVGDAEALFRREGVLHVNTALMSVEEIATKILQDRGMERRLY